MKKIFYILSIFVMVFVLSLQAHAALYNRGADSLGNNLIYDSDLNITWYDYTPDANTWENQLHWAAALTVIFNGAPICDWRLPTTVKGTFVWGFDGTTTAGSNITSSEMGHLFYTELGNKANYDTSGNAQSGWGLTNTGPFRNLFNCFYWSGTEYAAIPDFAWGFYFGVGGQDVFYKANYYYTLAVHPGDVAVAAPQECGQRVNIRPSEAGQHRQGPWDKSRCFPCVQHPPSCD